MKFKKRYPLAPVTYNSALGLVFAGWIWSGSPALEAAQARGYAISGNVTTVDSGYNGPFATNQYNFNINVDGCYYRLRIRPAEDKVVICYDLYSDGISSYHVEIWPDDVPSNLRLLKAGGDGRLKNQSHTEVDAKEVISCNGAITQGPMPPPHMNHEASIIWLAFASGCVLGDGSKDRLRPVWRMEYPQLWYTGISLPVVAEYTSQPPHLPRLITYYNDGKGRFFDPDKGHREVAAPPPFDKGFTNAILESEMIGTNGLMLPKRSVLSFFAANLSNPISTNSLVLASQTTIEAIEYSAGEPESLVKPPLKSRSYIVDGREVGASGTFMVTALVTNGVWPEVPLEALKERVLSHEKKRAEEQSKPMRAPAIFVLASSAITSLLIWYFKHVKKI
jgi:hypothetical protein